MKTVLIVDRELELVDALSVLLKSEGYKVVVLSDPAHLEQSMKSRRPDAVIVDERVARYPPFSDGDGHWPTTLPVLVVGGEAPQSLASAQAFTSAQIVSLVRSVIGSPDE